MLIVAVAALVTVSVLAGFVILFQGPSDSLGFEVMSTNGPNGASYEFKVNDFADYTSLDEGPLSDLDSVRVTAPNGTTYTLERDFMEKSAYSGEGGRRWVIYGPPGYGLPTSGKYVFDMIKDGKIVRSHTVTYVQDDIGYATDVDVSYAGRNITVSWTPPTNVSRANSYKVLVTSTADWTMIASLAFHDPTITQAILPEVPLNEGGYYLVSVALYYDGGFSYSEDIYFTFGEDPPKPLPDD